MEGCAIASPNMRPRRDVPQDGVRRNEMIRAREVRVIGADGEQLGILQRNEAIALAKEAGMDLVEVASTSEPPVCRIMDYGKFRFEQAKREKEAKKKQHIIDIKEVRMTPKIGDHDFDVKVKNAEKFLKDGDKVKVSVKFRGREIVHTDIAKELLVDLGERVGSIGTMEREPKLEGRNMIMILAPKAE